MANVLLTSVCNRKCPYCFAMQKVSFKKTRRQNSQPEAAQQDNTHSTYISVNNLMKVVEFLKHSGINHLSLLGGEPTLHPEFVEIMKKLFEADFMVKIFSNSLMPEKTAYFLRKSQGQVNILVNLNHPNETDPTQWKRANKNLSILRDRAALSFNIYKADFDMNFLRNAILTHGLDKYIRVGISLPIFGVNNTYLPMEDYRKVGGMIAAFTDKCAEHDIVLGLDCGFILCMFTPEEIGRMRLNNAQLNIFCKPIIDIGTDLDVWSCFPLSRVENVRLEDFSTRQQLTEHYDKKFAAYKHVGSLPQCIDCSHLRRQQCYGGCIVHTMRSFGYGNSTILKEGAVQHEI